MRSRIGTWALFALALTLLLAQPAVTERKGPASPKVSTLEDNGDIPSAFTYPVKHGPWHIRSTIGDGPHGSSGTGSGDYDFYRFPGLNAGWIMTIDVTADDLPTSTLDPEIAIYDSTGTIVATNDDFVFCCDSYLELTLPADGDYWIDVHGCCGHLGDPFDSSTGTSLTFEEGDYELTVALHAVHP